MAKSGIYRSSPNRGQRRHGLPPDMVVIHHTAMETVEAAMERLCDPAAEVSAHYLIAEDGATIRLVSEDMRAWHAGAGAWGQVRDVNSHSIGIELANGGPEAGFPTFPDIQMLALEQILSEILRRRAIPPERVIGHSDMAPGRKFDPGPRFNWPRLAEAGRSVWVDAEPLEPDWTRFRRAAEVFGYSAAEADAGSWQLVLNAFRLRFRPEVFGPLDGRDVGTIVALAEKWPCGRVDLGRPKAVF